MPKFILTALGSYGDVHPMVGLGLTLAARGHRVKIVTNPYFEDVVTNAGLDLLPIGTRDEYLHFTQHFHAWHPVHGPRLVMQYAARMLRPLYNLLANQHEPGETVYSAHVIDMASRVVGEKLAAPVASIVFAPGVLWSVHDSPRLKGAVLGPRVPAWFKQFQFWVVDAVLAHASIGRELNRLRGELGLRPVRRLFSRWLFAADMVLALFPTWFGPPQPDWPANTHPVGFPLWDSGSVPIFRSVKMGTDPFGLSDELLEFITAGPPPIAFSPGSANRAAHSFFVAAVDACARLGQRGILLTKYDDQLPAHLPTTVRHFGFVPLSKLLPRTAALVHHGGIGTCAQGLAAGIPQLVQPMSYDQFDNSRRLIRLGVADEISVKNFQGRSVAGALAPLLDSPSVAARCRELSAQCNGPAALAAACDALEQLANAHAAKKRD